MKSAPSGKRQLRPVAKLKQVLFVGYYPALLLLVLGLLISWQYRQRHDHEPTQWGVTFSTKYAKEMGLDWQKAYVATLDELGARRIRVMSYWDEYQPEPYRYDWRALDFQFDEAAKRHAQITLAIGQRQPRWPECHIPEWAKQLKPNYDAELFDYLRAVVRRYRNHPALASYQLENEAANRLFGDCRPLDREFLVREFELVQRTDPKHPVIINASNQSGVPVKDPIGRGIGFSIYEHAFVHQLQRYWHFWYVPTHWHSFRAGLVELLHPNSTSFIHELQTEPWGRQPTSQIDQAEQLRLMNPDKLRAMTDYAERTGMSEIYLWGAEWWYWQSTKANNPALWETARSIINQ